MTELIYFLLMVWACGFATTCTLVNLWFSTTLPVEIAIIMRNLLLIDKEARLMPPGGGAPPKCLEEFTRADFNSWLVCLEQAGMISRRKAHIMACKGCFSVHASYVGGLFAMWLVMYLWPHPPQLDTLQLFALWGSMPALFPGLVLRTLHTPTTR